MRRDNVLLPHPDSPDQTKGLTCQHRKTTSSTALTNLLVLKNTFLVKGKYFFKFFTLKVLHSSRLLFTSLSKFKQRTIP